MMRKGEDRVAWSLTNKMPLKNKAGEIIGTFGISKDITAMKLVEARSWRLNAQLLGTLMDNSPDIIYFKDRQSRFVRASKALVERHGAGRMDESFGEERF